MGRPIFRKRLSGLLLLLLLAMSGLLGACDQTPKNSYIGQVLEDDGTCVNIRGTDGKLYAIHRKDLPPWAKREMVVRVYGTLVPKSENDCRPAFLIRVKKIEEVK